MASKFAFFFMINIVTMVMAVERANAQLGGIGLGITNITGVVPCSLNVNPNASPFANAGVQLQCGSGSVLASTTTNNLGAFSMLVTPFTVLLTNLLNGNCLVVVTTPLTSCNASLPSTGFLASPLQQIGSIGSIASGILTNILQPRGFQLIPGR